MCRVEKLLNRWLDAFERRAREIPDWPKPDWTTHLCYTTSSKKRKHHKHYRIPVDGAWLARERNKANKATFSQRR
jgi:hypothetical protein